LSERRAWILLMIAAAVVALGTRKIFHEHQRIRFGYELGEARRELREIENENRRLRLEYSVLISPERVGTLAASLGMRPPEPAQIRVVGADNGAAHAAADNEDAQP